MRLARAELLYGARDQRKRLTTARDGIGSAEGCGDERYRDVDLPRFAKAAALLKDSDRAWNITATEMGAPEIQQSKVQGVGMIGRFSSLHRKLSVCDGLVEPTELGEHVGEDGPRVRRLDGGGPETLEAQGTLERDVPLEEDERVVELAPSDVRYAQKGRGDHLDRAIAESARDVQGLLPESDGPVVVAGLFEVRIFSARCWGV